MESTHDLDFVFWLLEPAKPIRVYSQGAYGYMQSVNGSYDIMWSTVTMDNGVLVSIGGGWDLPPMVSPESARRVMETYLAADLSAESGQPVNLPLNNQALSAVQELYKKFRTPV